MDSIGSQDDPLLQLKPKDCVRDSADGPSGFKLFVLSVAFAAACALTAALWYSSEDDPSPSSAIYWTETLSPSYQIIESIPVSHYALEPIPSSLPTHEAEINMLNGARSTIDVTAMYWNLLPLQDQTNCNETAGGLSYETCLALGGDRGEAVYEAFEDAAERGVQIRFLLSYTTNETGSSSISRQVTDLTDKYDNVQYKIWNAKDWYDGGIMHQKLWIVDNIHTYIGSSNMDWLSLAQVKEMGVVIWNSTSWGGESWDLFESWWNWSSMIRRDEAGNAVSEPGVLTSSYFSYIHQRNLTVPCWSHYVNGVERCEYPTSMIPSHMPHNINKPMPLTVTPSNSPSSFYLTSAPFETVGSDPRHGSARTFDLDGILHTIRTAKTYVKLSVMDFAPSNSFDKLWWGSLNDAILSSIYAAGIDVQLLLSYWAHTEPGMVEYLDALEAQGQVCKANNVKCGKLEIKMFQIPGWNKTLDYPNTTEPIDPVFPTYSRVAHGKFVVTDNRVNVGTSNYQWSYFYQVAGCSLNTDDEGIRQGVEDAFNRDWESSYSTRLDNFTDDNVWLNEKRLGTRRYV